MTVSMKYQPIIVEVVRGTEVESSHRVLLAIQSHKPKESICFGDPDELIFPRSSTKPMQALPILLTGAQEGFRISDEELALACASHLGEPLHVDLLEKWLQRLGLGPSDLECGTHPPFHAKAHENLLRRNQSPSPLHNNCSGKHIGMLATALHLSESTKGYVEQNHPVQQRILKITEHLTNHSLGQKTLAIDGCSIPAPSFPLKKVAQAFCEFGQPKTLPDRESMACKRVFDAFTRFPTLTSGTDHYCEKAMKQSKLPILVKMGAEGIIGGCLPERSLGFFLKSVDGSHRASELVLTHLMHQWNLLSSESSLLNTKMSNWENRETGYLRLKDNPDFKVLS